VTASNGAGVGAPALSGLAGPVIGAIAIYVSSSGGSDSGLGTIGSPYKTLAKVNSLNTLSPGTSVLFKRNDVWRNDGCATSSGAQLSPSSSGSAGNPIVFDAYGTGANPVIDGSFALGTVGAWQATGTTNVWQSAHVFNQLNGGAGNGKPNNRADDPGNLIWGISAIGGSNVPPALVNASYGVMKGGLATGTPASFIWYKPGDAQLNIGTTQGNWNFNTDTNKIQLYCVGNPATTLGSDLRAAIDTCCVYFNQQSNITIQNFTLQYCAATAIDTGGAGGSCNNITIRDLVVQWHGGGNISGASTTDSRYGDGYDVEGSCQQITMDRIWWHQIYDTGPGPQCGGGPHQDNITVRNNVCTDCGAFFSSFFLGGTPTASGLFVYNNTVFCTQNCWSNNPSQRPNSTGVENVYALTINTLSATVVQSNMYVANNIFAGIGGINPDPGFGLISTGWNIPGVNAANPYTASGPGGTGAWLDYNCWPKNIQTGANQRIALKLPGGGGNFDISSWCKGTNIGGAGTFSPALEVHGVMDTDPLFNNQSAFDFSLQSGSPCKNTGANLFSSGVVWDFNHNPRPSTGPFTMGAFQISPPF
jgi:hypothetical protein